MALARVRRAPRHFDAVLAVGVGGALGTLARYEIWLALPVATGGFPWAVFAANIVGALVLGVVTTYVLEHLPRTRYLRPFAGIGFCGGLTTFSTWMVDAVLLGDARHSLVATVYVAATLLAGLVSLFLGVVIVRVLNRERF